MSIIHAYFKSTKHLVQNCDFSSLSFYGFYIFITKNCLININLYKTFVIILLICILIL